MQLLAVDIETTGLDWNSTILTVAVATRTDNEPVQTRSWNLAARDLFNSPTPSTQVRSELKPLLQAADLVCGHNLCFDLSFLYRDHLVEAAWVEDKIVDTFILSRMIGHFDERNLAFLCKHYEIGALDLAWHADKKKRKNLQNVAVDTLLEYAEKDVLYSLQLATKMYTEALSIYSHATILHEGLFASVVATMRVTGIPLDSDKLDTLVQRYRVRERRLIFDVLLPAKIHGGNDATGLVKYLSARGVRTGELTQGGKEATDEKTLFALVDTLSKNLFSLKSVKGQLVLQDNRDGAEHVVNQDVPILEFIASLGMELVEPTRTLINVVLSYTEARHLSKALSTWLLPLYGHAARDGRIHALYTAAGAASYRLTCSEPALQAFPALDIWSPHVVADWSQAEYRLVAIYAVSQKLATAFAAGSDAHRATAQAMFGKEEISDQERSLGKTFNFATIYGAGIKGLIKKFGLSDETANQLIINFRKELPEIGGLVKLAGKVWKERGFITLWNGIRLYADPFDRQNRGYMAVNQLAQGGVAQLAKEAMILFHQMGLPVLGQIHDALQFPQGVDIAMVESVMTTVLKMKQATTPPVTMKVDIKRKGADETHPKNGQPVKRQIATIPATALSHGGDVPTYRQLDTRRSALHSRTAVAA